MPTPVKPAHLAEGTVAKVGSTMITEASYHHWLGVTAPASVRPLLANSSDYSACIAAIKARNKLLQAQPQLYSAARTPQTNAQLTENCKQQYTSYTQGALSELIHRAWTEGEARELGVTVRNTEVAAQIKAREASLAASAKNARYRALGFETPKYDKGDLEALVRSQLLEAQVRKSMSAATPTGQAEKYFDEHKQQYARQEGRTATVASTTSQGTAQSAASEHTSGGLTAVARKHSIPTELDSLFCEKQPAAAGSQASVTAAICAAKTGVVSSPVKIGSSYYLFEVTSITPASKPSFAKSQEQIKGQLAQETLMARWKPRTECAAGHVVYLCKEYGP